MKFPTTDGVVPAFFLAFFKIAAGWCAGVSGTLIGHPMDTIKTIQQMSNKQISSREVIKTVFKKNGLRGFYKGMFFPLLASGTLNSVYFGAYDASLKYLQHNRGYKIVRRTNTGWMQDLFIAGCIAGFLQALITCPTELIKIRVQLERGAPMKDKYGIRNLSVYRTVSLVYEYYGYRGFFIGLIPTVWRDAIGGGIYITCYQCIRYYINETSTKPGFWETLIGGSTAGFVSWIPVIPFDTIKSRIQADDFRNRTYKGMIHCSREIYRINHLKGFYKGFFMIAFRSFPVNIAIIYGYELCLWIFGIEEYAKTSEKKKWRLF